MAEYRIHKTKQGYFRVQMKRAAIKFFGITIRKERFISSIFYPFSHTVNIFDKEEEAQEAINKFIAYDKQNNKEWIEVTKQKGD